MSAAQCHWINVQRCSWITDHWLASLYYPSQHYIALLIPIANWWATTQLLIILTSSTMWPGGLCQLLTSKQLTELTIDSWQNVNYLQVSSWQSWQNVNYLQVSSWQRPPGWNILLVSNIKSCVVHQFAIGISSMQLWAATTIFALLPPPLQLPGGETEV